MKNACIRICFVAAASSLSFGVMAFDSEVRRHNYFFTKQEEVLVEKALPATIKCILMKQPASVWNHRIFR